MCATFQEQLDRAQLTKRTACMLVQAGLGELPISEIITAIAGNNRNAACNRLAGAEIAGMFAFAAHKNIRMGELTLPYFKVCACWHQSRGCS